MILGNWEAKEGYAVCSLSYRLLKRPIEAADIASIFESSFFGWSFVRISLRRDATPLSTPRSPRGIAFSPADRESPRYSSGFSLTRVTGSWFIPGTRAGTCHNICIIRELASSIFIFRNVHSVLNFISRLLSRPAFILLSRLSFPCWNVGQTYERLFQLYLKIWYAIFVLDEEENCQENLFRKFLEV